MDVQTANTGAVEGAHMKSIQARFVVLMIVIVSSMLGIFGVVSYADSKADKHQQLNNHLIGIKQRLTQSLPAVIWRFDREQIQQILDAEMGAAAIVGIAVYDEKERLLYSAPANSHLPLRWNAKDTPLVLPDDAFIYAFPLTAHIDNVTEALGHVRIHASSHAIDQSLQAEAIRIFVLILLMNLAIVAALCAVMRMVIMRPLNALRHALGEIASEGADLSLRLPSSPWREFEDVTNNFNAFAARLESALGASIDEVHQTISRIAQGDFSQTVKSADSAAEDTVIARLGAMQQSLVEMTEALQQAKQTADKASQAKTDFLANMSHEIRTPLNAILGLTRLAMRGPLPAQQQAQLTKVLHSANHLLGLINDILDFSKIEAGKLSLESVEFSLSDVLENVITLVGEKAVDKGLELVTDIDAQVPWTLIGDPLRLSQIMVNFSTNALKFTQRGEVVIYIRHVAMHDGQVRLRIGVRDTGIGIAANKQSSLFQNFVQADTSNSRQFGGTGLGLAITRSLAQLMQGHVGMQSIEGVGSDFWCEVGLGYPPEQAPMKDLAAPAPNKRALVVDDQATARDVLVRMLRDAGVQAIGVGSGTQALQTLRIAHETGASFDWVLIDERMPEMDGLATAARIQAMQPAPALSMWLLSAAPENAGAAHAAQAGFMGTLAKPLYASSLRTLLAPAHHAKQDLEATASYPLGSESLQASIGARILLVEDIEINREVALGLLEDLGIGLVVDVAENGQVALHRMTQQRYDAVFMDMHMPVMDGLTATRTMRSNAQWDAIPIIAMTANNMDSDIQRCMDAGMCDFVTKPIDPDRLREAIRKWVTATKPTAAPVPEIALAPPRMPAPAPEKSRSLVEALSHINGLDASYGLQNFAGKQATYREMLRRFLVQHQDIATPLQGALSSNDWHMLSHLAQATAEAATHVGALGVAAHAQHLLALALQEDSNADCQTPLNELVQSIHTLTDSVKNALGPVFRIDALSPIQG